MACMPDSMNDNSENNTFFGTSSVWWYSMIGYISHTLLYSERARTSIIFWPTRSTSNKERPFDFFWTSPSLHLTCSSSCLPMHPPLVIFWLDPVPRDLLPCSPKLDLYDRAVFRAHMWVLCLSQSCLQPFCLSCLACIQWITLSCAGSFFSNTSFFMLIKPSFCFSSRFSSSQAATTLSAVARCRTCSRASLLGSIMA